MDPEQNNQLLPLQYLILLDFDTFWMEGDKRPPCAQIVEINAIAMKYNGDTPQQISRFSKFVKPKLNHGYKNVMPELKNEQFIEKVIEQLGGWLKKEKEMNIGNSTFLTWGYWDLEVTLKKQFGVKKLKYPQWIGSYINLNFVFQRVFFDGQKASKLPEDWCKILQIPLAPMQKGERMLTKSEKDIQNTLNLLFKMSEKRKIDRKLITKIFQEIPGVTITNKIEYILALDFEATCQDNVKLEPCSQIIELPTMIIDLQAKKVIGQFHQYITPEFNPVLTKFCTELTGITQEMVSNKNKLAKTLQNLDKWIFSQPFLHSKNFCFSTCGDWDLASCLKKQCRQKNIPQREYTKSYINIKQPVVDVVPELKGKTGMMGMLKHLNIEHVGRHHSGIDDVRNISAIIIKLLDFEGFEYTRKMVKYVK